MYKGKRNPQKARKTKRSTSAVREPKQENEPGVTSNLELLLHRSCQTDPTYSQVATHIKENGIPLKSDSSSIQPASSLTETEISAPTDALSHSSSKTKTEISLPPDPSSVLSSVTETEIYPPSDASSHSSSEAKTGISVTTDASSHSSSAKETRIFPPSDAPTIQSESLSIKHTKIAPQSDVSQLVMVNENKSLMDQITIKYCNTSSLRQPDMEITKSNCRPKTPDNPILPEEMFSPNTINEFRSTVRVLFPNGPPPPPPVIPVKKHKKRDIPYIVGCTKRKRVPENKTLRFFKGDDYGITSKTNELDENEKCMPKKRGRKTCNRNWSKSLFNPKSEEIAARLKLNERVDELLRQSPSNETDSFMSNSYSSKPQTFSPLPSTSNDSEIIMKNEKSFNESLNYELCDEELPDIYWGTQCKTKKKKTIHESYSLRNKYLQSISNSVVIDEDVNNNNGTDFKEIDFCKILSKETKLETEKFAAPLCRAISPIQCTSGPAIDKTIINLDNDDEDLKPNANNNNNETYDDHHKVIDTIEIKDDYSEIGDSVPIIQDVIDIDEVLAELDAFRKRKGVMEMKKSVVTVIDPITLLEYTGKKNNSVDLLTPSASLNQTKIDCDLSDIPFTSSTVIEIPDITEPVVDVSNVPASKDVTPAWNMDVEFITETLPDTIINKRTNELRLRNNRTNIDNSAAGSNNDIEVVRNDFADSHVDIVRYRRDTSDPQILAMLAQQTLHSKFSKPNKRKHKLRSSYKLPAHEQGVSHGNNENAAPATSGQTPSINGELGDGPHINNETAAPATSGQTPSTNGELGDCPICMDRLSKNSLASTICGHVFCLECIKKCLKASGKRCPTCRKKLKSTGYHQVFL